MAFEKFGIVSHTTRNQGSRFRNLLGAGEGNGNKVPEVWG